MIKIACSNCGKKLEAPDESAGKRGKCPGCSAVLTVAAGAPMEECPAGAGIAAVSGGAEEVRKCPGCGAAYPLSTVICTSCGINLDTGAKLAGEAKEPSGRAASSGKLVLEGALAGVIMGVLVFLAILAVEIIWDAVFEGWASASEGFFLKLLAVVVMGVVVGSIVGIVTVITRSASAGQVLFVVPLALILFHAWRSGIIRGHMPPFVWIFAAAGFAFSGWILYVVFGAVAQGVLKSINWEKYG